MAKAPKAQAKPEGTEVYCVASYIKTSAGPMHHGDRKELPEAEATALKAKGLVE